MYDGLGRLHFIFKINRLKTLCKLSELTHLDNKPFILGRHNYYPTLPIDLALRFKKKLYSCSTHLCTKLQVII